MTFSGNQGGQEESRREVLKRTAGTITGTTMLGLAGCGSTATTGDGDQSGSDPVHRTDTVDEEALVTGPGECECGRIAGEDRPDGPPDWIETNLRWEAWYDASRFNPLDYEYQSDRFYYYNGAEVGVDTALPSGDSGSVASRSGGWYEREVDAGVLEFEVQGGDGFLKATLPEGHGHEVWFEGRVGGVTYWIGVF